MRAHDATFGDLAAAPRHGIGAGHEVHAIGLEQMLGHRGDPRRSIHVDSYAPPEHPWREDQIGVPNRVIGMKMRHERDVKVRRLERGNSAIDDGRLGSPHHAGAEVHEIGRSIDNDRGRGAG